VLIELESWKKKRMTWKEKKEVGKEMKLRDQNEKGKAQQLDCQPSTRS
jgi:hypothetical protein